MKRALVLAGLLAVAGCGDATTQTAERSATPTATQTPKPTATPVDELDQKAVKFVAFIEVAAPKYLKQVCEEMTSPGFDDERAWPGFRIGFKQTGPLPLMRKRDITIREMYNALIVHCRSRG